jgi:N-carbamoylputrescine amidase
MTVRIALSQRSGIGDYESNLSGMLRSMETAAREGCRLFCVPELALLPFLPQHERLTDAARYAEPIPGPTTDRIAAKARELGMVTVFNMYEEADGRFFDSSPVFEADGTILGVTRMVHITDYACFHERTYYHEGDRGAPVFTTTVGRVGVAICYDRHYPEYMRALGLQGAEIVVIPQAGALDEWPEGMYEAEVRTAAFQNGYFAALCNRVGAEDHVTFAGESFVVGPDGTVLARGDRLEDDLVFADLELESCARSAAQTLFLPDRRPELYRGWLD